MNNNNQNKNNNNDDASTNHQLGMLGLLALVAVVWKNEALIRLWFYKNILFVIAGGILLLAIIGFYLWNRFKKKEAEYFERRRALRQVEPNNKMNSYYKRRDS